MMLRIPYGLDRLPRALSVDDPRLPAAAAGPGVLRLNSEPLPPLAMPDRAGDHAANLAAAIGWYASLCGDYARTRRQFIEAYFAFLADGIAAHRATLAERLRRYDGLYTPEDVLWSAPRPLPRAWVPARQAWLPADLAFWDGTAVLAVELSARDTPRAAALRAGGVAVLRIAPDSIGALGPVLPAMFHEYWRDARLPASPFRRAIPRGDLSPAAPVIASGGMPTQ